MATGMWFGLQSKIPSVCKRAARSDGGNVACQRPGVCQQLELGCCILSG